MSPETEDERIKRIREAQIQNRTPNTSSRRGQNASATKYPTSRRTSPLPHSTNADKSLFALVAELVRLPLGATRDIVIGLTVGLTPAILALLLLPGVFKLFSLLILGLAGGVGYLLGAAPPQ